jgi:hypothetical protein
MADVCRARASTDGCSFVNISEISAIEVGGLSDIFMYANVCCPERDRPRTMALTVFEIDLLGADASTSRA